MVCNDRRGLAIIGDRLPQHAHHVGRRGAVKYAASHNELRCAALVGDGPLPSGSSSQYVCHSESEYLCPCLAHGTCIAHLPALFTMSCSQDPVYRVVRQVVYSKYYPDRCGAHPVLPPFLQSLSNHPGWRLLSLFAVPAQYRDLAGALVLGAHLPHALVTRPWPFRCLSRSGGPTSARSTRPGSTLSWMSRGGASHPSISSWRATTNDPLV